MQDEILKHSEKIYKTVKSQQHSFREKTKEVLTEIFIIVFAVTLSIWLHSWSEHRQQQKEAREFLRDIRDDVSKDLKDMIEKKQALGEIFKASVSMLDAISKKDVHASLSMNFALNTFKAGDGNYQGFKSSGKIGYIENKDVKKMILSYYETDLPSLYDVDKYQYAKHLDVWEMLSSMGSNEMFSNPAFKSKLTVDAQITEALVKSYTHAIENASSINKAITKIVGD